ncbi:MAG: alpha-glucosidase [Planctomycetes bacterium]|nr:alpha-glucosidase [Planctomycetota bacterium]
MRCATLLAVLVGLCGPVLAGGLEGALPPAVDAQLGGFAVRWEPSGGGQLLVRDAASGREVFATVPGECFVEALDVGTRFKGKRGTLELAERRRERTRTQTVSSVSATEAGVLLRGVLAVGDDSLRYGVLLRPTPAGQLGLSARIEGGTRFNRVRLAFAAARDEAFLGFGEQFTHLNLRGKRFPVVVREQGVGRGKQPLTWILNTFLNGAGGSWATTYAPIPMFLTSRMRGLCLENSEVSVFDLRGASRVSIEVLGLELRARILAGATPLELIESFSAYAGRMRPLPDWIHSGAVIGMTGGTQKVLDTLALMRQHRVALAGFFLQDWVGERQTPIGTRLYWNWEADPDTYPDWPGLVAQLRGEGLRVMSYVNPFLSDVEGKPGVTRNLFREAEARGFLVRGADGGTHRVDQGGFDAGLVDLTNPEAWAWFKEVIKDQVLASGVSGWMGDFGEALPMDAQLHTGDAARFHNLYPVAWQQLQQEAISEAGLGAEVVAFSRSGFTRSPGAAQLMWLGDQLTTWDRHDGLKSGLTALLSSGFSGLSLTHSDVGGYTSIAVGPFRFYTRSKELFLRWTELNAFTPVLRTHGGLVLDAGHQLDSDAETLDHFGAMSRLFKALFPYRKRLMIRAAASGAPLVRHPWLVAPEFPELLRRQDQFLLGDDVFVAPVVGPRQDDVEAVLPPGRWVHLWTRNVYGDPASTSRIRVPAPLGKPAAFAREGTRVARELFGGTGLSTRLAGAR